ncbi:Smr/MutS family protein [Tistrella mobilis]|uniref:Smr/MutS family protein n=1 Tax=Tistrella mobilis TaxID=171437 RepID=UPI0035569C3D
MPARPPRTGDQDALRPDPEAEARLFERAMRSEDVAERSSLRGPDLPSVHATAAAGDEQGVAPATRRRAAAVPPPAPQAKPVPRSARGISRRELELFGSAMSDVKPLSGHAPVVPPPPPPPPPAPELPASGGAAAGPAPASPGRRPAAPEPLQALTGKAFDGLDRRSQARLRRGAMPVEAMLDLHGHGREVARGMLVDFIARSHARGLRCVLVITGKGGPRPQPVVRRRGMAGPETPEPPREPWATNPAGVIRSELPRWLNEPETRSKVLAFTQARQIHGGFGAAYILLKRER